MDWRKYIVEFGKFPTGEVKSLIILCNIIFIANQNWHVFALSSCGWVRRNMRNVDLCWDYNVSSELFGCIILNGTYFLTSEYYEEWSKTTVFSWVNYPAEYKHIQYLLTPRSSILWDHSRRETGTLLVISCSHLYINRGSCVLQVVVIGLIFFE